MHIQKQERMTRKGLLCADTKRYDPKGKNEKILESKPNKGSPQKHGMLMTESNPTRSADDLCNVKVSSNSSMKKLVRGGIECGTESNEIDNLCGDDTMVVRFVDTAIVGKSEAEDACHHGLVEPTINTKEALNSINSMFREPLDPTLVKRRSKGSQPKVDEKLSRGFEVFVDEHMNEAESSTQNGEKIQAPLQIYIDEESDDVGEIDNKDNVGRSNAFVFPSSKDLPSPQARTREDTVVHRFVGATISDEPQVENVCHHGLVEPTVNLKKAMDDINDMFGKQIDFARTIRRKRQVKSAHGNTQPNGFTILPDVGLDNQQGLSRQKPITRTGSDLFEPTMCTKDALDEINKMFAMPLDF